MAIVLSFTFGTERGAAASERDRYLRPYRRQPGARGDHVPARGGAGVTPGVCPPSSKTLGAIDAEPPSAVPSRGSSWLQRRRRPGSSASRPAPASATTAIATVVAVIAAAGDGLGTRAAARLRGLRRRPAGARLHALRRRQPRRGGAARLAGALHHRPEPLDVDPSALSPMPPTHSCMSVYWMAGSRVRTRPTSTTKGCTACRRPIRRRCATRASSAGSACRGEQAARGQSLIMVAAAIASHPGWLIFIRRRGKPSAANSPPWPHFHQSAKWDAKQFDVIGLRAGLEWA